VSTVIDIAALADANGPVVSLLSRVRQVTRGGSDVPLEGFDGAAAVVVRIRAARTASYGGQPSLSVFVEQSADGEEWASAGSVVFAEDGTETVTVEGPADFLRLRWSVAGRSAWSIVSAQAAIRTSGDGGALPDPETGSAGDVPKVNEAETAYELASGVPTLAEVLDAGNVAESTTIIEGLTALLGTTDAPIVVNGGTDGTEGGDVEIRAGDGTAGPGNVQIIGGGNEVDNTASITVGAADVGGAAIMFDATGGLLVNGQQFLAGAADLANGGTKPELPATPTEQDIADALVALGLVTQAA
jgi:hypothetical protein